MSGQVGEKNTETVWLDHCRSAVQKFLMNAVVIDNQPVLDSRQNEVPDNSSKVARKIDDGMTGPDINEAAKELQQPSDGDLDQGLGKTDDDAKNQELHIQEISDSFANQQIACAFVFPKDGDKTEEKFDRIIAAALASDIVIIDWYLEEKNNPTLTKKVLRHIAEEDTAECGRMRLVCVYTGQKQIDEITRDAATALQEGGLEIEIKPDEGKAKGKHFSLLVLNKQDVDGPELPDRILDAFTELSNGLLPTFALAAVAAVRRNMHHIITRFSENLDAAYVANRLITDPPGDVAELIRELFVSECDTALGLEKVADNYLEAGQIKKWLAFHNQPKDGTCELNKKKKQFVDEAFIHTLQNNGIVDSKEVVIAEDNRIKFPEEKRGLVSQALYGGQDLAKKGEQKFARFVVLKREISGNTKIASDENWIPSLTLGTLLRQQNADKELFFYCLTPACDTLRLQGEVRTFLFIELFEEKPTGEKSLIIIKDGKKDKRLFIATRPANIRSFEFKGSEQTGRVMAERIEGNGKSSQFIFKTAEQEPQELTWIGEVRKHRANRDMADLNRMWLRFGINDSEYLRLAGKGKL